MAHYLEQLEAGRLVPTPLRTVVKVPWCSLMESVCSHLMCPIIDGTLDLMKCINGQHFPKAWAKYLLCAPILPMPSKVSVDRFLLPLCKPKKRGFCAF